MTWVVAEDSSPKGRTIFYIRLDTRRVDGLSPALARTRFRNSVVVDARSLGPLPRKRRRPALTADQKFYIGRWRNYYRTTWQQMLARQAPCELLPRTWWERWFALPCFSRATMLRSETDIEVYRRLTDYDYVRETVFCPSIPNHIHRVSLGHKKWEIMAYARIAPVVQADAGMSKWVQRVWYLDHRRDMDGVTPCKSYRRCMVPASITPGVDSLPFDGRELTQRLDDYQVAGTYRRLAQDFLGSINK